jgi:hypothetical protein
MIKPGSFAEACHNQNTIEELKVCLIRQLTIDEDCKRWGLSREQWHDEITVALIEKLEEKIDILHNMIFD